MVIPRERYKNGQAIAKKAHVLITDSVDILVGLLCFYSMGA